MLKPDAELQQADETRTADPSDDCAAADSSEHGHDPRFCPINAALTLLNGRWTPHIVHALLSGHTRFNETARAVGINPRTLRERLKELEGDGVVARRVITLMPPSVEYTLTEKGRALERVFDALGEWGRQWIDAPKENP